MYISALHLSLSAKHKFASLDAPIVHPSAQMESQLCRKCSGFFSGTRNIVDDVAHHQTPPALFAAAEDGCYICKCVASQFQDQPLRDELNFALTARLAHPKNLPGDWLKLSIWQAESSLDTITVYSTETWDSKQDLDQTKAEMMEEMEPEDRWRPSIGRNDIWGFCVWPTKGEVLAVRR